MTDHIYFVFDPPQQRIKIGVAKKLIDRMQQLQGENGYRLTILGIVEGSRPLEEELHARFAHLAISYPRKRGSGRHKGQGKEWFKDDPAIRDYIHQHAMKWDGSDTFPWNGGIPTFAMAGPQEWVEWLEGFAAHLNERPGNLVDQALAMLAAAKGFALPTSRWPPAAWPKGESLVAPPAPPEGSEPPLTEVPSPS